MTLRVHPDEIVAASGSPLLAIADHWERARLGDVAEVINGAAFKSALFTKDEREMPLIRIRDVGNSETDVYYDGEYDDRHVVEHGDLLVGMDGDFRVARWKGPRALLNQRVCRLAPFNDSLYDDRFLEHCVQPYLDAVHAETSSVTVKHLSSRTVADLPIPLPPRAEQERIVAALEEHLSHLDAAEASLRTALQRTDSLVAKLAEGVMTGAPVSTLGELAVESRYGTSAKCSYGATGPAVIRIPNVSDGRIRVSDMKFAIDASEVADETRLVPGDLVVIRTNGSRNLIGRAAVADAASAGLSFASYLIRYRFRPDVDSQYVSTVLAASSTRRLLEGLASTTAGQYNLSISKLDRVGIPLPTLDEQRRITAEVRDSLGQVAQSRSSIESTLDTGQTLRQSILAAAFSGKLVPQDPSDEPASALLERIRAEHSTAKPIRRPKAKT